MEQNKYDIKLIKSGEYDSLLFKKDSKVWLSLDDKITYLICSPRPVDYDIIIYDLSSVIATCEYDFNLNNIINENKFECDNIKLYPNILLTIPFYHHDYFKFKANVPGNYSKQRNFSYKYLNQLCNDSWFKSANGVLNVSNIGATKLQFEYTFKKDINGVIYCPNQRVIVQTNEETDMDIFSDLETTHINIMSKVKECESTKWRYQYITVEQYKLLKYCLNTLCENSN